MHQTALDTLEVIQNTMLSELMDEIPDDMMDNIANDISNCTQQNDFEKLLQLLYKTVIKYRRQNVKMYRPSTDLLETFYIAQLWQKFEKNVNYENRKNKAKIARWLYNNRFPQAICDHMLCLIDYLDLNLTVVDDIRLFIELVRDRWRCIDLKHMFYKICMHMYQLIIPYSKKLKNRESFISNYQVLYLRFCLQNTDFQNVQAYVQTFVEKWINYHDEMYLSKICNVILDVNSWHEWKCYQCNMINDKHAFECIGCQKGINRLYLAKYNKSQTFCVEKPFGLINHSVSQQVCIMCVCMCFFYDC